MKTRAVIFFICFLSILQAKSQIINSNNSKRFVALKWSPLHLLNNYPTIQISGEVELFDKVSLEAGGSPVLRYEPTSNIKESNRGYKLKSEVRYYFFGTVGQELYASIAWDMNNLNTKESATMGYDCAGNDCGYFQNVSYTENRIINVIGLRTGYQFNVDKWLLFDFNIGGGYRWVTISDNFEQHDFDLIISDTNEGIIDYTENGFGLLLGIKVGAILLK